MYFAANATWVLLDPRDGITIRTEAFDRGTVVEVKPGRLENALDQLEQLAKTHGKRPKLEIHCHGEPAQLHLGSSSRVNIATVRWFGSRLARCLRAGGQIELMACQVASQGEEAVQELQECEPRNIVGYRPAYHDALRLRKTRSYNRHTISGTTLPVYGGSYKPRPYMTAAEKAHYFMLLSNPKRRSEAFAFASEFATEDLPNKKFIPKAETDGVAFCLTLAVTSQCVVRAAVATQAEEESSNSSDSPIGNWENEVFDFLPNGEIKFLGASPFRGPLLNSFDLDRISAV